MAKSSGFRAISPALYSYQASLAVRKSLVAIDPSNAEWQSDLAAAHVLIGDVLQDQGNLSEALASYRGALAVAESLAKTAPGNARLQRNLAVIDERIGETLLSQKDVQQSIEAFQRALAIYQGLMARDPGDVQARLVSVGPLWRIGELKGKDGRAELDQALAILKPLAAANRLDANRRGWIKRIEAQISSLNKAQP